MKILKRIESNGDGKYMDQCKILEILYNNNRNNVSGIKCIIKMNDIITLKGREEETIQLKWSK